MCGVIGAYEDSNANDLDSRLEAGLQRLRQRGPDDCGKENIRLPYGVLALGHTRLSIIDLTPGGHQPMVSVDGRYTMVFNGEIYNYRELRHDLAETVFRSESDTEVLLACWAAWGPGCLPRLRGMFAFAVFDRQTQTLTCVRDGFGIKPLYYSQQVGTFHFASEIPALLALLPNHPALNLQRCYDYLVFGRYDENGDTFFAGLQQLPPGHILTVDLASLGTPRLERWWWPSIQERQEVSFNQAAEELRERFLDNIRLHLRSDVPLGAALSGGLDSSAVVCAIRYVEPDLPIHTFTYVARSSPLDEEAWADRVNRHVGAVAHKVSVSPGELAEDLDDMLYAQGEPFGSTSIYAQYRVYKLAREAGVTVTLDGQGADELFAGYNGYPGQRLRSMLDGWQVADAALFLSGWAQWPERSVRNAVLALGSEYCPTFLRGRMLRFLGRSPEPAWLNGAALHAQGVTCAAPPRRDPEQDHPGRRLACTLRDCLTRHGLPALLRHGDRNSMRWSLESRVPFLTSDMAEFVLGLPEHYLVSPQGETKYLLRAAMRGIVPDQVLDRRDKVGFATPELEWFRALRPQLAAWLDGAAQLPFLDEQACRAEVTDIVEGRRRFSWQAWRLINFCRWVQVI